MDKAILKKFAIESRKDLMEKIKNKINTFYIDEEFKKEQKGEIYVLSNEKHSLSLTNEEYKKRELLIKRIKELSLEQVIEEAAYTWFNRIIAIRYMEINDYLPLTKDNQSLGIRVLSSKDNTPDPEILKFTNLVNPDLDIDFKKEEYVELKDDNEKFKYVLLLVCSKLGRVIPQVFDGITDYIDILIPDNLLNDTGFITKVINEVPEENYNQVEIIGWMYQYYITEKKDTAFNKLNKEHQKIEKNDLPVVTQMFTPDWIVKLMVDNSITVVLNNKESNKEIYPLKEKTKINEIEKVKYCDLCCGSGHILVYVFNKLYEIYSLFGYNKNQICEIILNKNIFGLDIDNRAIQLSCLSLILNARKYDKNIFKKNINLNVFSIIESNSISLNAVNYLKNNLDRNDSRDDVDYIIDTYKNSKEYGSIIKIKKIDYVYLKDIIDKLDSKNKNIFEYAYYEELKDKFLPLINQSIVLSNKYNFMITNPPYRGIREVDDLLAEYLKKEYPNSKYDLYSVFLQRQYEMLEENGYGAIIMPNTWLTIGSYGKFREDFLKNNKIETFFDFGPGVFGPDVGSIVKFISMIFKKTDKYEKYDLNYINYKETQFKNKIYNFDIHGLPDYKIDFNLSDNERKCFEKGKKLNDLVVIAQGMSTSDNDRFLRNWFEVQYIKIKFDSTSEKEAQNSKYKWFPYNKGGLYRKWYGNNGPIINYYDDGKEVKDFATGLYKTSSRTIKNTKYFFRESITYTLISSRISARYSPAGFIFDAAGSSIFSNIDTQKVILALLSTKVALRMLNAINNSYNKSVGDLKILPIMNYDKYKEKIVHMTNENIALSKEDWDSFETSWDFKVHPLIKNMTGQYIRDLNEKPNFYLFSVFDDWKHKTEIRFNKLKENEEKLNEIFIDIYGLKEELTPEVEDKDITIRKADKEREIKSLISYAVGCMFGRYSLDKEGLIYSGGDFDEIYKKYKESDGGWAGASLSNYKVLNDNGKEISLSLEVDNDNIIPITDEAYLSDDIVERFKKFISVAYGENTLYENLEFIAETLGKRNGETSEDTIRRYFISDFYNDHIKIYQKRPIYWLFDSGKKNGFKCLIYMHRYNEGLVSKIRLDYLHKIQNIYEKELKEISAKFDGDIDLTKKRELAKKQADISAKLQETKEYDEKIAHIADQRIKIDLDDGVVVNYAKFSVKNPKTGKDESILAKIK